jgi:hypothetical protein
MPWIAAIAGAAVGGAAGGQKDKVKTTTGTSNAQVTAMRSYDDLTQGQGYLEQKSYEAQIAQFQELLGLNSLGPGGAEIEANTQYQNSFASQLQALMSKVGNQSQADIAGYNSRAKDLFAPEQTALNQQFDDQRVQSQRMSARLGRPGNDPILSNKLAQEQTRQQTMLNSQIGSYGRQLPEMDANQIMNIGGQLSNLRQGLASQALLSMGGQLSTAERNFRLQSATKLGTSESDSSTYSGGGFKGAATGAMSGAGMGMSMGSKMS